MIIKGIKSLISTGAYFPYESSWLIYIKILQWNRIRDFKHLMDFLDPAVSLRKCNNDWWNSTSSPLNVLGAALGQEVNELKFSFVDGWFPRPAFHNSSPTDSRARASIRHCPECVLHGYHSVIFYFDHITHCPWHHLALEPCVACSTALAKYWPVGEGVYKAAERCEHLDMILDIRAPKETPTGFYSDVREWVDNFKLFAQQSVNLIGNTAYDVIAVSNTSTLDKALVIDFLVRRFGFCGFNNEQSRKVSILRDSNPMSLACCQVASNSSQLSFDAAVMRPIVKAMRRYIVRRYIRHHRKCFARLNCLHRSAWYMLDAKAICPCVLAYLLVIAKYWMVPPYDVLSSRSKIDVARFCLREGTGLVKARGEFERNVVCMLGKFYELWGIMRNIEHVDYQCVPFADQYPHIVWNRNAGFYYAGRARPYSYNLSAYFFMEDPQNALDESKYSCSSRQKFPLYLDLYFRSMTSFVNAQNVYCVIYNMSASQSGYSDVHI